MGSGRPGAFLSVAGKQADGGEPEAGNRLLEPSTPQGARGLEPVQQGDSSRSRYRTDDGRQQCCGCSTVLPAAAVRHDDLRAFLGKIRAYRRTSRVLPSWPYTTREFLLWPDFTNQTNSVERYVRPFTIPVFIKYLKLTADEMEKGLVSYRKAALAAPPEKRHGAYREVLLAEQLERMLRSNDAVLEFETMRFQSDWATKRAGWSCSIGWRPWRKWNWRDQDSLETALRDSRLGYEWEEDYIYRPFTVEQKIKLLRQTINQEIPDYRSHGAVNR